MRVQCLQVNAELLMVILQLVKLPKTTGRDPRYVSVLSGEPEIIENNIQTDTSKSEIDELKEQLIEVKNKLEKLQEEFDKFKEQFEQ